VRGKYYSLWRSELGLDISHCFPSQKGTFIPDLKVSWIHEMRGEGKYTTAGFVGSSGCTFVVDGFNPTRDLIAPSFGLWQNWGDRFSLNLRYGAEVDLHQAKYWSQELSLRANCRF
jgi:outer membrane autotransporter protein